MILRDPFPHLSIVIPVHDEEGNIGELLDEIGELDLDERASYEIVVVNDGSQDGTASILDRHAERTPELVIVEMDRQSGQSAALLAGFEAARGQVIVTMDGDRQNDPADICNLLDAIETDGFDMAIGWRKHRRDPWSKKIISRFANGFRNWMTSDDVRDTGCGLKAFRRECVVHLPRFAGVHRFLPTLAKIGGAKVAQVPVNHRPRQAGKTHYRFFNRLAGPIVDLFAVRWLQARAVRVDAKVKGAVLVTR